MLSRRGFLMLSGLGMAALGWRVTLPDMPHNWFVIAKLAAG